MKKTFRTAAAAALLALLASSLLTGCGTPGEKPSSAPETAGESVVSDLPDPGTEETPTTADGTQTPEKTETEEEIVNPFDFDLSEYVSVPDLDALTLDAKELKRNADEAFESLLAEVEYFDEVPGDATVKSGDITEIYYKGTLIVHDGEYAFTVGQSGIPGLDEALENAEAADGRVRLTLTLPEDFTLPEGLKREDGLLDAELAGKEVSLVFSRFGETFPKTGEAFTGTLRFEYVFPGGTYDETTNDGAGYELTIGSGSFIPGFEDGMIGMSAAPGSKRVVPVPFPDPYRNNPALSGEASEFEVTIIKVKSAHVFDLDDEDDFALFKSEYEKEYGEGSFKHQNKNDVYENCLTASKKQMIVSLIDAQTTMIKDHEEKLQSYRQTLEAEIVYQYSSYYYSLIGRMLSKDEIVGYFFGGDATVFDAQIVEYARTMLKRHMAIFLIARNNGLAGMTLAEVDDFLDGLSKEYSTQSRTVTAEEILGIIYSGKKSEVTKEIVTERTLDFLSGKIRVE